MDTAVISYYKCGIMDLNGLNRFPKKLFIENTEMVEEKSERNPWNEII